MENWAEIRLTIYSAAKVLKNSCKTLHKKKKYIHLLRHLGLDRDLRFSGLTFFIETKLPPGDLTCGYVSEASHPPPRHPLWSVRSQVLALCDDKYCFWHVKLAEKSRSNHRHHTVWQIIVLYSALWESALHLRFIKGGRLRRRRARVTHLYVIAGDAVIPGDGGTVK